MKLPKNIKILDHWWFGAGNIQFKCHFKPEFKTIGIIKFSNGFRIKHYICACKGKDEQEDIAFIYHFGYPFSITSLGGEKEINDDN